MSDRPCRSARALALVTDAYGCSGGIAQYNCDFLAAFSTCEQVGAVIVLPRRGGTAPSGLSDPICLLGPVRNKLIYFVWAIFVALKYRPIHVVFCGHLFMAPLALLVARLSRAKLIIQTHGIEAWQRPTRLRRWAVEAADLILCVSRHTRASLLRWCAISPERVLVLPNTVGEIFTPGDGTALRKAWGLQDKRVLLTVGRMDAHERYKGHDRVITALPQLLALGHDIVFVVVGDGDDLYRLQSLAEEKGILDRVRFVGVLGPLNLVEAYRMADVFLMPSTGEGFGIAFLEAMACGTPAVGLACGGSIDALGDGKLGVAALEKELPITLANLLSAPKGDRQLLAAAVRARFGREAFTNQLSEIMTRILADNSRTRSVACASLT